jgi:hypothetical protein
MRSYDYCHFEVTIYSEDGISREDVRTMLEGCRDEVDAAVERYKEDREWEERQRAATARLLTSTQETYRTGYRRQPLRDERHDPFCDCVNCNGEKEDENVHG